MYGVRRAKANIVFEWRFSRHNAIRGHFVLILLLAYEG
jgi:hypothetical protein